MCKNSDLEVSILLNKKEVARIVEIHIKSFQNFFLTFLGKAFLTQLYVSYIEDERSGIIVCKKNGRIIGFIAYSKDYSGFYKRILKKRFIQFGYYAFFAFLRNPKILKRLLSAFNKSEEVKKDSNYIELASIAVDTSFQAIGIGKLLLDYLKNMVDFNEFDYINLETDAINNEKVNNFYLKNEFSLFRQYQTNEGRLMNEYRYGVRL